MVMGRKMKSFWCKYVTEPFYSFLISKICQKVCGQVDISPADTQDDLCQNFQTNVIISPKKIYDDSFIAIFKRLARFLVLAVLILFIMIVIYCCLDMESIKEVLALIVIPLMVGLLSSMVATLIFIWKDTKEKNLLYCNVRQKVLIPIFSSIYALFSEIAVYVVTDQLKPSTDCEKQGNKNRDDIFYQKHTMKEWTSIFTKIQESRSKAWVEGIGRDDAAEARKCAEHLTSTMKNILSQIEGVENKAEVFNLYQIISIEESSALRRIKLHLSIILRYSDNVIYQSRYLQNLAVNVESGLKYFEDFKGLNEVWFGELGIYISIDDEENIR